VVAELVAAGHHVHTGLGSTAVAAERLHPMLVQLAERAPVAVHVDPPPDRPERLGRWLDAQLARLEAAYGDGGRS
jgi:hypothetical protein